MNKKITKAEQTKKRLEETFLELYSSKGMSGVTVGAITKKAGYNRCTFYNYYDDLNSMLDEIEDNIIEQIQEKMSGIFISGTSLDINTIFPLTHSVFEEYGNMIYILLGKNGDAAFRQRLQKIVADHFREIFRNNLNEEQTEYILTFAVSAALGLIEHWYETDKKYSAEDFLRISQSLLANGILGQLQKQT